MKGMKDRRGHEVGRWEGEKALLVRLRRIINMRHESRMYKHYENA